MRNSLTHIYEPSLRVIRLLMVSIVTAVCLLLSPMYGPAEGSPIVAVENMASEIRMSSGAVGQVLMEAMLGKFGEMEKWQALDRKMSELEQTTDRNLPAIGELLAVIYARNPGYSVPDISIGCTFDGNLTMVQNKKKQLLDLAKKEWHKYHVVENLIARVNEHLLKAAKQLIVGTAESFLPDSELEIIAEPSVKTLNNYFGEIAWGATSTFDTMIKSYYNIKSVADQAKVLTDMKQLLLERKKEINESWQKLMEAVRELDQIEKILDKHNRTLDKLRSRINEAKAQWSGKSQSAFENHKKKQDEEFYKRAAQPTRKIDLSLFCFGVLPSIEPDEYMGEVKSIADQLHSYAQALDDGGDPEAFMTFAQDWYRKIHETRQKQKEEYDKIKPQVDKKLIEASKRYSQAINALSCSWHDEYCRQARENIYQQYRAECRAICAELKIYRDLLKTEAIISKVMDFYYLLANRISVSIHQRKREFWDSYALWRQKFQQENIKVREMVQYIPWNVDHLERNAQSLDQEVNELMRRGVSIDAIRSNLLDTSEYLRNLDRSIKETINKYEPINNARNLIANQAQADLNNLLSRYGKQVIFETYFNLEYWKPRSATVEDISARVKSDFTVTEPENLTKARKLNLSAIARLYENKAQELTFYADWVETYHHRLNAAAERINQISWEQTGAGLYTSRQLPPRETIAKEFLQPPFSVITKELETMVKEYDLQKLFRLRHQPPWDQMTIGQKLQIVQDAILQKMYNEVSFYVRIRKAGRFLPVSEDIIKPLETLWQKLTNLCKDYESAVDPLREGLNKAEEEVSKERQKVRETWERMPYRSYDVSSRHARFSIAVDWLYTYLREKNYAFRFNFDPAKNSTMSELDMLIASYRPALEKYLQDQQEAQRRQEEEQRRLAEEEQRRQEAMKKQAEELINRVKDLYASFKTAYESRNDSHAMSLISDSWEAGDGTTLSDLQSNLRRNFRTFDEIRYDIQNLRIEPIGQDRFKVSYDVAITSRIFRRNIKHSEKSSVIEEVIIDNSGKVKIFRTLSGRYWY